MDFVTLDGYIVRRVTDAAIGIAKAGDITGEVVTWLPRSLCENGGSLELGDEDISVASWKAEQEELDF